MKAQHRNTNADMALFKELQQKVNEELQRYRYNFRFHVSTKLAVYLGSSATLYYLLYQQQRPLWFVTVYVFYGLATLLFAFNFSHDFSHNTVFKNKWLNNFCFTAIYTLVGAHAQAWKHRHIHSHHHAPNVEAYDSDLQITSLIRVTPGSKRNAYHALQAFYAPFLYTTYSLYWVFIKDLVLLYRTTEIPLKNTFRYHVSFWFQKLVYIVITLVLPYYFSGQPLGVIVCGFIVMHMVQSLFLLFTFFMTHHVEGSAYPTTAEDGSITCSWLMNQIKSSNDMHPFSKTANYILGGFNNHIAHHLFPHIHHAYYPKISKTIYPILVKHGIQPNSTSYVGGIVSHLKHLHTLSKKK